METPLQEITETHSQQDKIETPSREENGLVGSTEQLVDIGPLQPNAKLLQGQKWAFRAWMEDGKTSDSASPSAFFDRSRFVIFFYCVRGLTLPGRVSLRRRDEFGAADLSVVSCFCALNLLRVAAVIPILFDLDAALEKKVPSGNAYRKVYVACGYFIGPALVLGNVACTWKRRTFFRKWHVAMAAIPATSGGAGIGTGFSRKQTLAFNVAQALLIASWLNVLLYFRRAKLADPVYASLLNNLTFFEVTYHCDLTPLMLMHLYQLFDSLAKEARELLLDADLVVLRPNRQHGGDEEALSELCRKWLALKRVAEGMGKTASLFWLPFMLWGITSIAFNAFEVSQKAPNGAEDWMYWMFSIACRAIFMLVACNCGHSVTFSARKFLKILSEFNSQKSAAGSGEEDLRKETQRFLAAPDAHDGVVIPLSGFCELNRSIVGSTITMIITIYIGLLQLAATR